LLQRNDTSACDETGLIRPTPRADIAGVHVNPGHRPAAIIARTISKTT